LSTQGCALAQNYDDPNGPRYAGSYSTATSLAADDFTLATFNIEFGIEVARATDEIRANAQLANAAVLLLQEMDAPGTDRIARDLRYDYVYYPGSVQQGKDNGNAVLSRWPIVDDRKLILPYRNPTNGRIRIAVRATLDTPTGPLVVYSVHTDTVWLGPSARLGQAQAIIDDARNFAPPLAVGGDFNTLDDSVGEETVRRFEGDGYRWATSAVPPSAQSPIGPHRLDYVFVKGLAPQSSETEPTDASDHQPVWVELERTAPQ
jgi:endonuclease/exonuclease/phosphatase family metal-dependent hydrolase